MSNHDTALNRAIDRDLRDSERLKHIEELVSNWLDELAPDAYALENPTLRWQPGDLVDCLLDELHNIRREQARLTGPVFIEEC